MRKKLIVLGLVLALGGCAQLHTALEVASLATKSYTNPVTKDDLYKIESGIELAFVALNTYKRTCVQGLADAHCKANIAAIQAYTRQIPPLLAQLRGFVKNNDQVNATVLYNQIVMLIANLRSTASATGVNIGG